MGPSWWGDPAQAGGRGPHSGVGRRRGGMEPAAAALRLSLVPGAAWGVFGTPPPPDGTDSGSEPCQQGAPTDRGLAGIEPDAARRRPLPPIPPPPPRSLPWPSCDLP